MEILLKCILFILCLSYTTKPAPSLSSTLDDRNDIDWLEALTLRHLEPKLGMTMKDTSSNSSSRKLVLLQLILSGV